MFSHNNLHFEIQEIWGLDKGLNFLDQLAEFYMQLFLEGK